MLPFYSVDYQARRGLSQSIHSKVAVYVVIVMTLGMMLRKWNEAIKIVSLGEEYLGICRALCRTNVEPLFNGHFRTRLDPDP